MSSTFPMYASWLLCYSLLWKLQRLGIEKELTPHSIPGLIIINKYLNKSACAYPLQKEEGLLEGCVRNDGSSTRSI